MNKELRNALVTTGGTREPIDDVRFITNFATGKFGYAISRVLVESGFDVTVACPKDVPAIAGGEIKEARHENFTDTESLRQILLTKNEPAIIFHAAAVSDYRPKKVVEGKISSNQNELIIELERTPKILSELRNHYGNEAFLIGFKLLSGVSRNELINVAKNQNKKNHLNLTVANDLSELKDDRHPVILVTAEGGAINIDGSKEEVAKKMVEFVKKRADVTWYKSERTYFPRPSSDNIERYTKTLKFAQKTNLLYDESGNVSVRAGDSIIVSPRQVDKSKTTPKEAVIAKVDHATNTVFYDGEIKSSIDTAVSDAIYKKFPNVKTLLHFHSSWGKSLDTTTFPYPCGVKEEAEEIMKILEKNNVSSDASEFAIELLHHGVIMALPEGGIERLEKEWEATVEVFNLHLMDVGMDEAVDVSELRPIFANTEIVGVVREHPDGNTVFLGDWARGKGLGRKIVDQLIARQAKIQTIEDCNVLDFYRKFGFAETKNEETGVYTFTPPKPAATDEIYSRMDEWKVK